MSHALALSQIYVMGIISGNVVKSGFVFTRSWVLIWAMTSASQVNFCLDISENHCLSNRVCALREGLCRELAALLKETVHVGKLEVQ